MAADVADLPGVLVDPPALGVAEVADLQCGLGERVAQGGEVGDVGAGVPEADDVGCAVAVDVGQFTDVLVDPPAVHVGEEALGGHGMGRPAEGDPGGGQRRRGDPGEQTGHR
ncbi:hypothetical protein ACT4S2_06015 [Kocuria turfanensis]|uniref:hypothetical protein n=1 Tax=Kocuria turfanensis TaxID=388357 RepID=UPI004035957E